MYSSASDPTQSAVTWQLIAVDEDGRIERMAVEGGGHIYRHVSQVAGGDKPTVSICYAPPIEAAVFVKRCAFDEPPPNL